MSADTPALLAPDPHGVVAELLVTWQNPHTRRYEAVGSLTHGVNGYRFVYLDRAASLEGFTPFLGFPDLGPSYHSEHLFPLFAERVMSASRPDRPQWLQALALGPDPEPMEVLSRGGHRPGDSIELLPMPTATLDGRHTVLFLVRGVRYHGEVASAAISALRPGNQLELVHDADNAVNERALLVAGDGIPLGWIPGPLLEFVHGLDNPELEVVRANGPEVGSHLRLLVRVTG